MKYYNLFPFCVIQFIFVFVSNAQVNNHAISGQILNQNDNQPIEYVSIYLKGQNIGTSSNSEGKFIFHVPNLFNSDTVIISMIGFESIEKPIRQFAIDQKILLSSMVTDLNQVVISSTKRKKLSARQIVKKAYKSIKYNFPNQKYILEGFVRDLQIEDGKYVEYLECAAKFLYAAHDEKYTPEIELIEIRNNYISDNTKWDQQWDRKNSIMDLIEDDFIRFDYGPIKGKRSWKYHLDDILLYNGGYVYKIIATDSPYQSAILYIDIESFAFVRMELTRKANNGKSWKRKLSNGQLQIYYNGIFEYQEIRGKMYLKYQKEEDTWEIYDLEETDKLLVTKSPKKELIINHVIFEDVENYPFERNMQIDKSLENQLGNYNAAFWSKYNAPSQTAELSKIERDLKNRRKND